MTPADAQQARFTTVLLAVGYDMGEVDAFLRTLAGELAATSPAMTASDVTSARFTPVQLQQGYQPDEVDELMDWAAATLRSRAGGKYLPPTAPATPRGSRRSRSARPSGEPGP